MKKEAVENIVNDLFKEYNNNIPLKAVIVDKQEEIYGEKASRENIGFRIDGSYHPARGILTFASSNLYNEVEIRRTFRHEVIGHYGLNTYKPEEKRNLLDNISKTRNDPSLRGDWNYVDKHYSSLPESYKAEEIFSRIAEKQRPIAQSNEHIDLSQSDLNLNRNKLESIVTDLEKGLREGARAQQIFPKDDHTQFKAKEAIVPSEKTNSTDANKTDAQPSVEALEASNAQSSISDTNKKTDTRALNSSSTLISSPTQEDPKNKLKKTEQDIAEKTTEEEIDAKKVTETENADISVESKTPQIGNEDSVENNGAITESRIKANPAEFDSKYTIERALAGASSDEKYYHKGTNEEAFRDKGTKIIVRPESKSLVAADVAKLADSKGWTNIKVTGNKAFKREVWKEANIRGIEVTGYKPTEQDKRDLDKSLNSIEAVPRTNQSKAENTKIAPSLTPGVIGDSKSVNPETKQAANDRSAKSSEATGNTKAQDAVERRAELSNAYSNTPKKEAIKKFPELSSLYKLEGAAQQFASTQIKGETSQTRFIENVRDKGLDQLSQGSKLPELKSKALEPQLEKGAGIGR